MELKNTTKVILQFNSDNNSFYQAEKRIGELEESSIRMIKGEKEKSYLKRKKKLTGIIEYHLWNQYSYIRDLKGKEKKKEAEKLFEERVAENFPNYQERYG